MLVRDSSGALWRLLVGVLVVTGALAGCAGSADVGTNTPPNANGEPPNANGEPPLDPKIVALADPKVVTSPLADYRLDAASAQIIDRARELVGNACMRQFGFTLPASGWSRLKFDFHAFSLWSRYGIWDPIAEETGYLFPMNLDESSRYVPPFTGEASEVFSGEVKEYNGLPVPAGGCAAEMTRTVTQPEGAQENLGDLVEDLDSEAMERSRQDSRVVPLLDAWRSCMKQHGWDYADVLAPFSYWNQPPRRGVDKYVELGDISAEEKASAHDDLACKQSTGLLATWLAVDVAYQQAIVDRESEKLREYSQHWEKILANANQIIAEGGR